MRHACILTLALCVLTGCSNADRQASEVIENQVGRWEMIPAQNGYPVLLLDTATGCLFTATVSDDGQLIRGEAVTSDGGHTACDVVLRLPTVETR